MTDRLPPDIETGMREAAKNLGPFADRLSYFTAVSSTNDVAARMATAGAADGTIVLAAAQTAGRGRGGHAWFSPPESGLYFSLVLRGIESAIVTLMAGVAVAEAIRESTGLRVELKWPNDVVVPGGVPGLNPPKMAGILTEASSGRGSRDAIILGIGINVSNTDYPPELAAKGISIERALGAPVDRGRVFVTTLATLARWRDVLLAGELKGLRERWSNLAPSSVGAPVAWLGERSRREGVTAGLDVDGALLVTRGCRTERIMAGDLTWL